LYLCLISPICATRPFSHSVLDLIVVLIFDEELGQMFPFDTARAISTYQCLNI
jgi:hypothetical protein